MNETTATATAEPLVFERKRSASTHGAWWVVGGCALLGVTVLGFLLTLLVGGGPFRVVWTTTVPMMGAIGAFLRAWSLARAELRVVVCGPGVVIEDVRRSRRLPWESIGGTSVESMLYGGGQALMIFDKRGKKLAKISDAFVNFQELASVIQTEVRRRDQGDENRIKLRRLRKASVFVLAFGVLLLSVTVAIALTSMSDRRAERLLRDEGVSGTAQILRLYVAPDGVTRRLQYRITTPDGRSADRDAEMERDSWEALEGYTSVPVLYVPKDPEISRLRAGERLDPMQRPEFMLMGVVCGGLGGVLCFVIGVLTYRGWDMDWDPKTKKLSLKRIQPENAV